MNMNFCSAISKTSILKRILSFGFLAAILLCSTNGIAQNVGINGTGAAPNNAAMLDVSASNKGFMAPQVALTAINVLAPVTTTGTNASAAGCIVYNTNTNVNVANPSLSVYANNYYYWDGSKWNIFIASGTPIVNTTPTYFTTGSTTFSYASATWGAVGTYTSTTWTVPAGIYQINVFVVGGGGGGSNAGGNGFGGGNGGVVTGIIDVSPGEVLTLYAGAGGTGYASSTTAGAGVGGTGSYITGIRNGVTTLLCAAGGGGSPNSAGNNCRGGGGSFGTTAPSNGQAGVATSSTNYTGWLRGGIAFKGGDDVTQADYTGTTSMMFTASYAGGIGYGLGGDGTYISAGSTAKHGTRGAVVIQW